jgi:anti-anti-sigma factor
VVPVGPEGYGFEGTGVRACAAARGGVPLPAGGDRRSGGRPTARVADYEVVEREGERVVLQLRGELTESLQTEALKEALEEHYVDDGVRVIEVDLAPLRFLDNYGVATLVALQKESRDRGKRFHVEGAGGQVREKLRVTGVLRILEQG